MATLAYYGPDAERASKVAVGIILLEGEEPAELERWLAPDVELDLREGGDVFVRDDDGRERHGTVVTVEPPQRLVYTWDTDGIETTVEIALDPLPDGTRIRISESAETRLLALAA